MIFYVIDIIGRHSGMHYYNDSFREVFSRYKVVVQFLTNYNDSTTDCIKLFQNQYEGSAALRAGRFLKGLCNLYGFLIKNSKNCFIYYFYGNLYEHLYLWPLIFIKRSVVDVHDYISTVSKGKARRFVAKMMNKLFFRLYRGNIIVHSDKTAQLMMEDGCKAEIFRLPHMRYLLNKSFDRASVRSEIVHLIDTNKINLLFFGYIRESKGVDVYISIAKLMAMKGVTERFNLIIAGNDPHKIVYRELDRIPDEKIPLRIFLNYVNDDELKFLFTSVDYIILPYREISQSGILEMAVHFRKPVITSNLSFFKEFIKEYGSFGCLPDGDFPEDYLETLIKLEKKNYNKEMTEFYSPDDLKKYEDSKKWDSIKLMIQRIGRMN